MRFSRLFWFCFILAHLVGVYYGFTFWYKDQLLRNPFYLWPFLPVSPLYALLFSFCFVFRRRVTVSWFSFLVAVGLVEYGLWGVGYWLVVGHSLAPWWLQLWLVLSHGVMTFDALLLLPFMSVPVWYLFFGWGWFGLTAYIQYLESISYESLFPYFSYAAGLVFALTFFSPLIIFFSWRRFQKHFIFLEKPIFSRQQFR